MGAMYLLYASLTEYVLFFGTAIHTSGHSGIWYLDLVVNNSFEVYMPA